MTLALPADAPIAQRVDSPQDVAIHRLAEWAQSADAAYRVAQRLVESAFVPAAFRGKPVEATAAILSGIEIGLSPMSALKAFDIIQGQAAPKAITQRAVALAHGHEIELVESTATRCRVRARRRGSESWQSVNWTIDRARELGLLGKDNWKKQPIAMLQARATSEAARLVAADALLGIAYSSEEIADGVQADPGAPPVEQATDSGARRMSRRPSTPPAETATPDDPDPSGLDEFAPETTHNPATITDAQMRKMQAAYRGLGIDDRDERLADASAFLGRDVATSKELTKDEASRLIDYLEMRLPATLPDEPA